MYRQLKFCFMFYVNRIAVRNLIQVNIFSYLLDIMFFCLFVCNKSCLKQLYFEWKKNILENWYMYVLFLMFFGCLKNCSWHTRLFWKCLIRIIPLLKIFHTLEQIHLRNYIFSLITYRKHDLFIQDK